MFKHFYLHFFNMFVLFCRIIHDKMAAVIMITCGSHVVYDIMVVIQQRDWLRKEKKHCIRVRLAKSTFYTFYVCFLKGLEIVVLKQP
jgi:hypothetical protein